MLLFLVFRFLVFISGVVVFGMDVLEMICCIIGFGNWGVLLFLLLIVIDMDILW